MPPSSAPGSPRSGEIPLVVDLDGTLIQSDLLVESVFALLKKNILYLFLLPLWLLRGKASLKREIAHRVAIDPALLPYQPEFLSFLQAEHASGRRLVLATASNEKFASAVAGELGIFDDVLASTDTHNLSGARKLKAVKEICRGSPFDYAGNAMVDLALWREADSALLVNPERGVRAAAEK
ncbi:MAG: haloacid dehalogenase-like hydrolase, partial [Pseudomonadota bacterium]